MAKQDLKQHGKIVKVGGQISLAWRVALTLYGPRALRSAVAPSCGARGRAAGGLRSVMSKVTSRSWPLTSRGILEAAVAATPSHPLLATRPFGP